MDEKSKNELLSLGYKIEIRCKIEYNRIIFIVSVLLVDCIVDWLYFYCIDVLLSLSK